MIELNLLPDVKQEFIRTQTQKKLIISSMILTSIIAGGIVILLAFIVFIVQPGVRLLIDHDITDKRTTLQQNKNLTRDLTLQNQLASITPLHEDKGVYSRFFDYFKNLNPEVPNNISISQATVDAATTTISLDASAKNFQAIAVFQDTLKNAELEYFTADGSEAKKTPLFSSVSISDAGLGQNSKGAPIVSFKAVLAYDSNAFDWTVKNPTVSIPNKSTTPSASQVSVFSETPVKKQGVQ